MNIIYKIFYMLVGRSIESELRTNKIVKLRYDFINERKRDILFLLYFSLWGVCINKDICYPLY